LLIYNVKEGWKPLCDFLDVPIPDGPFPNTNDTKMMKKRMRIGKIRVYSLIFGLPFLIGNILYIFLYFRGVI
jgi:hypothetical protein